ncbi:rapid alkalinization factor [Andrographis paniculata]|uniref:rapid alkalinization factor n=1 Tax=Andrographis paniculata TaxID=175694 RepID=UPI0021E7FE9B|nr:rapid alkalinization factor [Andrographis paniculata]
MRGVSKRMLLLLCSIVSLLLANVSASGDHGVAVAWMAPVVRSGCKGTVGGCLIGSEEVDEEFELESESTRRILAMRRYISYGALRRNSVPCSRRGASYYNCRPGAQANPYRRGCSAITRCRR